MTMTARALVSALMTPLLCRYQAMDIPARWMAKHLA